MEIGSAVMMPTQIGSNQEQVVPTDNGTTSSVTDTGMEIDLTSRPSVRSNKGKITVWNAFIMEMRSKGVKDMKTIGNMYRSLTSGQIDDLKRRTEQVNRGEACPSLQAEPSQPKEIGCITTGEIVDLSELETELDRVCSHPHSKLAPSDLFPGFQCIAYDSKLGIFSRCEVNQVFYDSDQTVNCFSLDHGHKFATTVSDIRPLPKVLAEARVPYRTCYLYLSSITVKDSNFCNQIHGFEDFVASHQKIPEIFIEGFDRNFNFCGDIRLEEGSLLSETLLKLFKNGIMVVQSRLKFKNRVFTEIGSLKLPHNLNESQSELLFNQIRSLKLNPKFELKSLRGLVSTEVINSKKTNCEHQQWDQFYDLINLNDIVKAVKPVASNPKQEDPSPGCTSTQVSFPCRATDTESGSSLTDASVEKKLSIKPKRKTIQELKDKLSSRKKKLSEATEEAQKRVVSTPTLELRDVDFNCKVRAKIYNSLKEEGFGVTFHEQTFVMGLFRKPWGSCGEIENNLGHWKFPPAYFSALASYAFPLAIRLSCDIVGIHSNKDQRLNFLCNLIIYGQTARVFKLFEGDKSHHYRGINLKGPMVVIVVPSWRSALNIDLVFKEQVSRFTHWKPNVRCDYGWGESINCHILITTPSRLCENLNNENTNFNRMKYFIIEEAEIIFEKFPDQIAEIVKKLKRQRNQSLEHDWRLLIFGQSFHPKVERFLGIRGMKNPEYKQAFAAVFTDLFEASLFVGATHYPVVCEKPETKTRKVLQILQMNRYPGAVFAIVCRQDNSCHQLAVKCFDKGYDVICFINQELKERYHPEGSEATVVVGTDNDLTQMLSLDVSATFLISFESPKEDFVCESKIAQRCVLLNESLAETLDCESTEEISMPKIFHLISEDDSIEYLSLLWKKFDNRVLRSHLDESFYRNFESLIQLVLLKLESEKTNEVELCPDMMINPCRNPQNSNLVRCGSLCCNFRHTILPQDKPGTDFRVTDIPTQGYCRIRIRAVLGPNFYSATIEHYRKTQNENFVPYCAKAMRQIEDGIDDIKLIPVASSEIAVGRLYLVKQAGVVRRCMVRNFVNTNEYGHPSMVSVFRIDAGDVLNSVLVSSLYQIPMTDKSLRRIPGQAIRVILTGIAPVDGGEEFTPEITKYIEEKVFGKSLEAMIVSSIGKYLFVHYLTHREKLSNGEWCTSGYRPKADLLENNYCIRNDRQMYLLEEVLKPVLGDVPSLKSLLAATDTKHHERDSLEVGVYIPVYINPNYKKTSPSEFFVIKQSSYKEIFALQRTMHTNCKLYKTKLHVEPKQFVIAQVKNRCLTDFEVAYLQKAKNTSSADARETDAQIFSDALEWYRARVWEVSVAKKTALVFLLDFGEMHEVKISKLKQCPPDIFKIPGAAICCFLSDVKPVEAAYGFKPEIKDWIKQLGQACEMKVLVDKASGPVETVVKKATSAIKTSVKLFHKNRVDQDETFFDFSRFLCSCGLAVGSTDLMGEVFKSVLKDQFLKLHTSNDLDEDSRSEMLKNIWNQYSTSFESGELMHHETFNALFVDIMFIIRSYQSSKILQAAFEIAVQLSGNDEMPEQLILNLSETVFKITNLNEEIVKAFCVLLNKTDFSSEVTETRVCCTIVTHLGKLKLAAESVLELLTFLDSKSVWKFASEESFMAPLNRMFRTLVKKYPVADMIVLYKIFLWCMKNDSFSARMGSSPLELSLILKQYKSGLELDQKFVLIQIINQFMKFESCKFTIANTNSFIDALRTDISSVKHVIKALQMKKLLSAILEYREEKVDGGKESATKQATDSLSHSNEVRDLTKTGRDLSEYTKLTPKVSWWQSEYFITISLEIFGVKEKQIDYTNTSIDFQALTLEDKYYCFRMDLFGEIAPDSTLESFSGRQVEIRVNKKETGIWERLTVDRMNNLVYNVEQMLSTNGSLELFDDTDASVVNWMTYRAPGLIKNFQPDFGYGRSSESQDDSEDSNLSYHDLDVSDLESL